MRFELKHDKLAVQIYDMASAEAKARRKAEGIYLMYAEIGNSRLFTAEELDYLAQFQSILRPNEKLLSLISQSKKDLREARMETEKREREQLEREKELIERSKTRQKKISGVITGAFVIASVLLFLAFQQYRRADVMEKEAEDNKTKATEIKQNLEGMSLLNAALKEELSLTISNLGSINPRQTRDYISQLNEKLPSAFVDPRDWNVYETVELNGQVWMAENLRFNVRNQSWIPNVNKDASMNLGRLYTWEGAMEACPEGWHLASEKEWLEMAELYGGERAFDALVEGGNANFKVQLAGNRGPSGNYNDLREVAYFWTSEETNEQDAKLTTFLGDVEAFIVSENSKDWGFSCRCVKNAEDN